MFKSGDLIEWTDYHEVNLARILKVTKSRYLLRFIVKDARGKVVKLFDKRVRKKTVHKFNPTQKIGA